MRRSRPSNRGGGAPALIDRLRAAYARHPDTTRLLVTVAAVLGLWLFALDRFSEPRGAAQRFRIDANDVVAHPKGDAAMDFLNGIAILSGDGWVNWRADNRWSVYRPGWGAFLGGLTAITGHDFAAMQRIITILMAATAPIFMLLVMHLFPGGRDLLLGAVAAMVLVLSPLESWWFQRTMMSEGSTLLLSLLFCLLAVRFCNRLGSWSWRQGLLLGLVGGAVCMVRSQSRFGVLAVFALLAIASAGKLRRRLPFLVCMLCGLLALLGPVYLKTSIHLRMPYGGTSYMGLYSVLRYTPIGRDAGGHQLPEGQQLSEREATKLLQERVRKGISRARASTPEMVRDGFIHHTRYIHGGIGKAIKQPPVENPGKPVVSTFVVFHLLTAVGIYFAWRRVGPVALAPLVFSIGYILPMVPFWFYRMRFGIPISWVGLAYLAGAVLLFAGARAGAGAQNQAAAPEQSQDAGGAWPAKSFFVSVGLWLVLATSALLWMDLAPLPKVDVQGLFAQERSRQALRQAGVEAGPELVQEADRLLNGDGESERLLAGIALFPITIDPDDSRMPQPFHKRPLRPGEESYSVFHLVSPWKRGDSFRISQVRLRGRSLSGLRDGDEVIVVRTPGTTDAVSQNLVFVVEGAAVLPTRWAD